MLSAASAIALHGPVRPARYRSLQTLLFLMVGGSLLASVSLLPTRLERISAASERGDSARIERLLERAATVKNDPGEVRALADMALVAGKPSVAAAILEHSVDASDDSIPALRLLREVQRQRHDMRAVAALGEQLYARAGDVDALREAADLYVSQRRTPERISALQRLAAAKQATAQEIAELAQRLSATGNASAALKLCLGWFDDHADPAPELLALAAALSASTADAVQVATRLGQVIGRGQSDAPLPVLVQAYAARGKPELSLVAARALGHDMLGRPEVAVLVAQIEALEGDFPAARARLRELEQSGRLPSVGLPMLAELDLQAGDLSAAAARIAALPAGDRPEKLEHRMIEAAFSAGRLSVLQNWSSAALASASPGDAAVVALAQGDRGAAETLARTALQPGGDLPDLGPAFGSVLRSFGLERLASDRLLVAARSGTLSDNELGLLLDIAASPRANAPALLKALRAMRDSSDRAGMAWVTIAARGRDTAEVVAWLNTHAAGLPAETLVELLQLSWDRSDRELATAAGTVLLGRSVLPQSWSRAEVEWMAAAAGRPTPDQLRAGLKLVGSPGSVNVARDRIAIRLSAVSNLAQMDLRADTSEDVQAALLWLSDSKDTRPDHLAAYLGVLAAVAPQRALDPLAHLWGQDPARLLPLYAAALLRTGHSAEAQRLLTAALGKSTPAAQDALLFDVMRRVPQADTLSIIRVGAQTGRKDWVAALEDGLVRAGLIGELRVNLRTRAGAPGMDPVQRQAIASRLVELGDRSGAIDILRDAAAKLAPTDTTVEQLVFLWGPRASPDAIAWLRERALTAPLSQQAKWLDDLAYVGAPQVVAELLQQQPSALASSSAAVRALGSALLVSRSTLKVDLDGPIKAATSVDTLLALTRLAIDNGQNFAAWHAISKALPQAPNNAAVLTLAAQAASLVHRSGDAASFFEKLLQKGPQPVDVSVDAADALLVAHRGDLARQILSDALTRLPRDPSTVADARLRARVLFLSGKPADAAALLWLWLTRLPGHSGLQADLLALRLADAPL